MEKVVRGFSNHRRIQFLYLIADAPGLDVAGLAAGCRVKQQTATEHLRRMEVAGLILKRKKGRQVLHSATELGLEALRFLDSLSQSN